MIKVLLADDSLVVRAILRDILNGAGDIVVAGEAENGREAVELTSRLKPDLVIMDIMMPVMDGLVAIEEIMAVQPTPILVLSATMDDRELNYAFTAIRKGALDVMGKPDVRSLDQNSGFGTLLAEKVRLLSGVRVIRRFPPRRGKSHLRLDPAGAAKSILAIGASTGGPKAVTHVIRNLPASFPGTVVIVQHIASGFARGFAQWLNQESALSVHLARDGQECAPGQVLIAPNDTHMLLERGRIRLSDGDPVNCCKPSVDLLFNSIAEEDCSGVVGVILTGMGRDGAQGLGRIRERGGFTIAQDEKSCVVFGMPKAAIAINAVDEVLPLDTIPETITRLFAARGDAHGKEKDTDC